MSDVKITLSSGAHGLLHSFKDIGDGSFAPVMASASDVYQVVPDFKTAAEFFDAYGNFSDVNIAGGDFVTLQRTANGQQITALSASSLNAGESKVKLNLSAKLPCALEIEASMIRNRQQFATLTMFKEAETGANPAPGPFNIASIHQSNADFGAVYSGVAGTICTIVLDTALAPMGSVDAVFVGDWVHIDGIVNSRLNYQNACIKWISQDRKTITVGFSDEVALPSLAIPAINPTLGTAKLYVYQDFSGADTAAGYRFAGTSATSACLLALFGGAAGADKRISGTLIGDHRTTIATTAPTYNAGANGNYELRATSRYRIEARPSEVAFLDKASDNVGVQWAARGCYTAVKPDVEAALSPRFRVYQPPGMSRPIAKIASIAKTGTTTATVATKSPHGLVTGQYVNVKGVRDQVNFTSMTTAAAVTVIDATTFTITLGSAVTATSQGGAVHLINGGADQPGIIGQYIQSVAVGADGVVTMVGNTNWSGLNIGDYVDVYGVIDTAGNDLVVDGAWEVFGTSSANLYLKPITDILGVRRSPAPVTMGVTNCGGVVILRTTLRAHDMMFEAWDETKVVIDGQGTTRADKAIPVVGVGGSMTASQSTAASLKGQTEGTTAVDAAMPNPIAIGGRASNANIAAMSANGDLAPALMTMIGALIVKPFSLPEADWRHSSTITVTTDVALKAAGAAGIKNYLTALQLQNTGAAATIVSIKDGASTVIWSCSLPASMAAPIDVEFPTPLAGTAATALNIACGTASNVITNAQGYQAP